MSKDSDQVDLYLFATASRPYDILVEFAQRIGKPCGMMQDCCGTSIVGPACIARGIEFYAYETWEKARRNFRVLRVRKVIRETKALCVVRANSNISISAPDSFLSLEDITSRFGIRFRYLNTHELLDQTEPTDPMENHCTPGRMGMNPTAADLTEIKRRTDEFIAGAQECHMERDLVENTIRAHYIVNKFLDAMDCNAFTAPCPDMCATRRINEGKFTYCLTHSLNNESGIPSACEYDVSALLSMIVLSNLAGAPAYMGNSITAPLRNGIRAYIPRGALLNKESVEQADAALGSLENVCLTFHAVPNRFMKGYDTEMAPYSIRSFAHSGFGATIRYDFNRDKDQVLTMCRFDPTGRKLFVARGTVVGGIGYGDRNCSEGVFFQVRDGADYYEKQIIVGNHMPLVYGDYVDDLLAYAKIMGLEVLLA